MLTKLKCKKDYLGKSSLTSGDTFVITLTRTDNDETIKFEFNDN